MPRESGLDDVLVDDVGHVLEPDDLALTIQGQIIGLRLFLILEVHDVLAIHIGAKHDVLAGRIKRSTGLQYFGYRKGADSILIKTRYLTIEVNKATGALSLRTPDADLGNLAFTTDNTALQFIGHRLAKLVQQYEGALVRHV